jgi:hypothetical protein
MEKVVNIQEKIKRQEQKKQLRRHRGKIKVIQKVAQCSSCHLRCAMCGQYLSEADTPPDPGASVHEYIFCEDCRGEYEDFMASCKGMKTPQVFWHNREWEKMWSAWLGYQRAIADFVNSREFRTLVKKLTP